MIQVTMKMQEWCVITQLLKILVITSVVKLTLDPVQITSCVTATPKSRVSIWTFITRTERRNLCVCSVQMGIWETEGGVECLHLHHPSLKKCHLKALQ